MSCQLVGVIVLVSSILSILDYLSSALLIFLVQLQFEVSSLHFQSWHLSLLFYRGGGGRARCHIEVYRSSA